MQLLLILVPALPLALALGVALWPRSVRLAPLAPLPALLAALLPPPASLDLPFLLLGARLGVDVTAQAFLLFGGLLWLAAAVYALIYLRADGRRGRFFVLFLMAMAGNLGLLVAEDVLSFYALFALMSISAYGLVTHGGTATSERAGRVYIAFVFVGEIALFAGLLGAASLSGSLLIAQIEWGAMPPAVTIALVAGFGVKLGVVPLHLWLPLAHPAAPVPASAVLSGTMIKAGLFGLLTVLPLGAVALPEIGAVLILAGLCGTFGGVLFGLAQDDPKAVLAYSSVSQMGLVVTALGYVLAVPEAWVAMAGAVTYYAAHHALAKASLFLGVGVFAAGVSRIWRAGWLLALAVPAAVLAAAPFTSGEIGKASFKAAFGATGGDWSVWLLASLTASSTATTLLMARFLTVLWVNPPAGRAPRAVAWSFLALLAAAALVVTTWPFGGVLTPAETPDRSSALAPIAIGVAIAALCLALSRAAGVHAPRIAPGDALEIVRPYARAACDSLVGLSDVLSRPVRFAGLKVWSARIAGRAAAAEATLSRWNVLGVFVVGLLVAFLALEAGHLVQRTPGGATALPTS